ncbi:MAG: hypothetical protein RJB60_3137, partial [Pseudomonadota bacterium]
MNLNFAWRAIQRGLLMALLLM